MASRGRGRGKPPAPMAPEQIGTGKDEQLLVILHPPPKYPPLEYKAPEFICSTELSYLIELKRSFNEMMQESPNNVELKVLTNDIERYSDVYKQMMQPEVNYDQHYDWTLIPSELMPTALKRKRGEAKKIKKLKVVDIDKKLEELEKKETMQDSDTEETAKADGDDEEKDPDENVEDEEVEVDEEMDDGTDYYNNYFDNGEGYDEEDDNLDDGATF
ncbi:hypothetical protein PV325_001235 [Microctonus aethiopoides]|uniref:DNA-directed RNA polymerase III subunit n=1 Tax=Microctonus aethiopoides TaxID=144406 RepID=A0AA39FJD8_9HYME|nr:hypothetical protein PV325_001235 [Microctonus aethiopoides]KAK0170404.1 hypothetical protein PV328_010972 [Microctonus aethiopoides]